MYLQSHSLGPGHTALTVIPFSAVSTATAYKEILISTISILILNFCDMSFLVIQVSQMKDFSKRRIIVVYLRCVY